MELVGLERAVGVRHDAAHLARLDVQHLDLGTGRAARAIAVLEHAHDAAAGRHRDRQAQVGIRPRHHANRSLLDHPHRVRQRHRVDLHQRRHVREQRSHREPPVGVGHHLLRADGHVHVRHAALAGVASPVAVRVHEQLAFHAAVAEPAPVREIVPHLHAAVRLVVLGAPREGLAADDLPVHRLRLRDELERRQVRLQLQRRDRCGEAAHPLQSRLDPKAPREAVEQQRRRLRQRAVGVEQQRSPAVQAARERPRREYRALHHAFRLLRSRRGSAAHQLGLAELQRPFDAHGPPHHGRRELLGRRHDTRAFLAEQRRRGPPAAPRLDWAPEQPGIKP